MPSPSILCESDLHAEWFARPLVEAGFNVQRCTLEQVPQRLAGGQFSVLILGRLYVLHKTRQQEEAIVAQVQQAMAQLLRRGGGVFLSQASGGTISLNPILDPYGISLASAAIDVPMDSRVTADHQNWRVRHGCTREVRSLRDEPLGDVWFPAEMGSCLTTRPLICRPGLGWRAVLGAPPGSTLKRLVEGQGNGALVDEDPGAGWESQGMPILSVREGVQDAGRLAVCGIASGFHLGSPHTFGLARQFLHDGFEGRPSKLAQLLVSVMQWLSEPALQRGLGGAPSDADLLVPQVPRFPDDPPVIWPSPAFPPVDRPWRGLIGARTTLSVGRGSVADYVQAARRRGLNFLVFLEDYARLDADRFAQLKQECQRLSDDTFLAVPGYTIDDVAGNHSFQYGYQVQLPRPDLLSADGKTLSHRGVEGTSRNLFVDNLHGSLAFGEFQMRCRRGFFRHGDSRVKLSDHRYVDSLALVTWHDGQVVDDIRGKHRALADNGRRLNPTIITLLDSPADVGRALDQGWHNQVLEPYGQVQDRVQRRFMAPELEWWGFIDEQVVGSHRYRFDSWQYGLPFQCASSGPVVEAWTVSVSDRDRKWRGPDCEIAPTADWFRVDVTSYRLAIRVSSDCGLREVRLYDGAELIRRWDGHAQNVFEQELDLTHHQQTHLLLEATDVAGGIAITSEYLTFRRDWCEFYCADRNNPLQIGYEKDEQGLAYGWSGTLYLTYNNGHWGGTSPIHGRWWYYGDKIYPVPMDPRYDPTQPTDGGVGFSAGGLHLMPDLASLNPPEHVLMIQPRQEMISTDVAICGFEVSHGADRQWPGFFGHERTGWSLFPTEPTRYVEVHRRAIVFRPRPGSLTTTIYQHDLRLKRPLPAGHAMPVGWLDEQSQHMLQTPQSGPRELASILAEQGEVEWRPGDAVIAWTNNTRPAIFLNDGAPVTLRHLNGKSGRIALALAPQHQPGPGASQRLRFVGMGGTAHHRDPEIWTQVAATMGWRGKPRYHATVSQGSVISQRLLFDVQSEDGGVQLHLPRVELPTALPLRVHGLNPRWPAVLFDRSARRWRPLGMLEGVAYAVLDTLACDWSIYVGHPVLADDQDLVLALAQVSARQCVLEVHNPTTRTIHGSVRAAPGFELLGQVELDFVIRGGDSRLMRLNLTHSCDSARPARTATTS